MTTASDVRPWFRAAKKASNHSHMGRSILAVLLVTIRPISRVSYTITPVPASHCLSSLLHAIAAAAWSWATRRGRRDTEGRAKPLKLQQLDCQRWGARWIQMVSISDRTLDALLNHLRFGLVTILARSAALPWLWCSKNRHFCLMARAIAFIGDIMNINQ